MGPMAMSNETARSRFATDEERWDAVVRRDRATDGTFYYSVRTTGVYCRPSCGVRLVRRENVRFHATCVEAEQAGFRPCKRCGPDQAAPVNRQAIAIAAACRLIEAAQAPPTLDELARAAGMSRFHFHRVFRALTGVAPRAYADARHVCRVREEFVAPKPSPTRSTAPVTTRAGASTTPRPTFSG